MLASTSATPLRAKTPLSAGTSSGQSSRLQGPVSSLLHLSFPSPRSFRPHVCLHTQGLSQRCLKPARWSKERQRPTPRCCSARLTHFRPRSTAYLLAVLHAYIYGVLVLMLHKHACAHGVHACLHPCCACMNVPIVADTPAAGLRASTCLVGDFRYLQVTACPVTSLQQPSFSSILVGKKTSR